MPQYEFKNKDTGEVMEVDLSGYPNTMSGKKNNPQWERYHSSASAPKLVTGVKSTMADGLEVEGDTGKDWEKHLTNIKKASGKDNTINV